jgi:hypothetical protein
MTKKKKPGSQPPPLDPSHPNYDAIMLKQARLEAHRRRRMENSGALIGREWKSATGKPAKQPTRRGKS